MDYFGHEVTGQQVLCPPSMQLTQVLMLAFYMVLSNTAKSNF